MLVSGTLVSFLVELPQAYSVPHGVANSNVGDRSLLHEVGDGHLGAVASESVICSHHGTEMLK